MALNAVFKTGVDITIIKEIYWKEFNHYDQVAKHAAVLYIDINVLKYNIIVITIFVEIYCRKELKKTK